MLFHRKAPFYFIMTYGVKKIGFMGAWVNSELSDAARVKNIF